MKKWHDNKGFSLAETLIALGILAIGMLLIAGAFPVAIRLTTLSAERTTAAVVAEEAFAKVKLYGSRGIDYTQFLANNCMDFNTPSIFPGVAKIGEYEFIYPSDGFSTSQKQYCWSALCRLTNGVNSPVQVIVFVCRKAGPSLKFPHKPTPSQQGNLSDWPVPYQISSVKLIAGNMIKITDLVERTYVTDGSVIVDSLSGQLYRVVGRLPAPDDYKIQLDKDWPPNDSEAWVIPPAVTGSGQRAGGRNPCIAVYQKEIQF